MLIKWENIYLLSQHRTFKMTKVDLFTFKSLINEFVLISTYGKEIYLKERPVSY